MRSSGHHPRPFPLEAREDATLQPIRGGSDLQPPSLLWKAATEGAFGLL